MRRISLISLQTVFHRLFITLSFSLCLAAIYFLFVRSTDPPAPTPPEKNDGTAVFFTPYLPDGLSFAGEKTPLEDPEVSERLDQEMLINVHSHAATAAIIKRFYRWKEPMLKILREEGVPEDFIYLMVAESSVRNATSYMAAQGYWQFLAETARECKLRVTKYVDERNDPLKSTRAACLYLKKAYGVFGSWSMVAASYNMGMNGLNLVINEQQERDYYDLYLNRETSRYLFRILSYKIILENPAKFGYNFSEKELYQPIKTKTVKIDHSIINLVNFAKEHNTNYKTLVYLNPWILKPTLPINYGETYDVLLPE